MSISYKQINTATWGKGEGKRENDNYHCHYKSYEGGLQNEASVIGPTNFGEDWSYWRGISIFCLERQNWEQVLQKVFSRGLFEVAWYKLEVN